MTPVAHAVLLRSSLLLRGVIDEGVVVRNLGRAFGTHPCTAVILVLEPVQMGIAPLRRRLDGRPHVRAGPDAVRGGRGNSTGDILSGTRTHWKQPFGGVLCEGCSWRVFLQSSLPQI